MAKTLSATRLREVLSYHPATGIFRWRGAGNPHVKADQVAGCAHSRGPVVICVDRKLYRANRLAWLYMTGKWPKFEVGFINRNASDIRWANLREMTAFQRRATARATNKSGVKGVSVRKSGKYVAFIKVAGKKRYLGSFETIKEAAAAYAKAAKDLFGQFARA